jgi:hypothetical protein
MVAVVVVPALVVSIFVSLAESAFSTLSFPALLQARKTNGIANRMNDLFFIIIFFLINNLFPIGGAENFMPVKIPHQKTTE